MDIKKVNEALANIANPDKKVLKFVQEDKIYTGVTNQQYGNQGKWNEFAKIYEVIGQDFFLKVIYSTDSYGTGETLTGVQFVKPVEKVVKVYETI